MRIQAQHTQPGEKLQKSFVLTLCDSLGVWGLNVWEPKINEDIQLLAPFPQGILINSYISIGL